MNEPPAIKFAAIDTGSNGIRIVIASLNSAGEMTEIAYQRAAVRLGQDSFATGEFSEQTLDAAAGLFRSFRRLMDEHRVTACRAVATSAMREARNGHELVDRIGNETGIELEIIDGLEEAHLVLLAVGGVIDLLRGPALIIDMGGGSVEVTLTRGPHPIGCESFPIGPVRLMRDLRDQDLGEADVPTLLQRYDGAFSRVIEPVSGSPLIAAATGGNIERLAKLRCQLLGKTKMNKLRIGDLESLIPDLLARPIEERISRLNLRPDRADVIAIAAQILHMIMDECDVRKLHVPGVGLKEGLLRQIAQRMHRDVRSLHVWLDPSEAAEAPVRLDES